MAALLKSRTLTVKFQLAQDSFAAGSSEISLAGLRASAHIEMAGAAAPNTLQLTVYGMTLNDMNKLTTLGRVLSAKQKNTITLSAGDTAGQPSVVFDGLIYEAYADLNSMPSTSLKLTANAAVTRALQPPDPILSFKGGTDIQVIMQKLADQMGLKFEGNNLHRQVNNAYLPYSPFYAAQRAAASVGLEMFVDGDTLVIWDPSDARGGAPVEISPDTGMIGYPTYASFGLSVRVVYNPACKFGGAVTVKNAPGVELNQASGDFTVYGLTHDLESSTPNGRWETTLSLRPKGAGPIVASAI
jgi:hypothetical protein